MGLARHTLAAVVAGAVVVVVAPNMDWLAEHHMGCWIGSLQEPVGQFAGVGAAQHDMERSLVVGTKCL